MLWEFFRQFINIGPDCLLQIILGNPRVLRASDVKIREYRFEMFQVRERSKVGRKYAGVITERTCKCMCMSVCRHVYIHICAETYVAWSPQS